MSKDDISDGRHRIEPCQGDVTASGPGPGAGEDKPCVYDLPVTLDIIRGDTSNLLVVEVVVDVETETVKCNHLIADYKYHLVLSSTLRSAQVTRMSPRVNPRSGE